MTKKFVTARNEFLIPDVFDFTNSLVGIETGKVYKEGLVVFTGVNLDKDVVMQRVLKHHSLGLFQKIRAKRIINNYLSQISEIKVGKKVKLDLNGSLIELK